MGTSSFVAGGALTGKNEAIYIARAADQEAIDHVLAMNYLLLVEPRQQGKTSLVNRLMRAGALQDISICRINVSSLDVTAEENWYGTLCGRLLPQWQRLFPGDQRPAVPTSSAGWRDYLSQIAASALKAVKRIVVALDEIGADDFPGATRFFSVLREVYDARQAEPELYHLTFLLSGAFHPRDLIQDDRVSPFNVAHRVRLEDLTLAQVQELVSVRPWSPEQAHTLADRIHFWTDGQPYLTQLLCSYLKPDAGPADVDAGVERLRREDENHLPPILKRLHSDKQLRQYVDDISAGKRIKFYPLERNRQAQLELLGVLKADKESYCRIRNRIYEQALYPHDNPTSTFPLPVQAGDVTMNIPHELSEQLGKGNVVLFCGAGISVSDGGIPSGGQLARELSERAGLGDAGNMTLPDVAQGYELEMGHQSLIAFIAERIEGANHVPLRTHQLIAALPFKHIITTNWDTLLEEALRQVGKPVARVVRNEDVAYVDEEKITLVKLHGSIDQKDTIVVTGDDYYDVFARLPETANLVRGFFATKTLLFLGYGLTDEDFKGMFHEVERHLGKHKRRAYAVQLSPTTLAVKYWQRKNVEVIAADATAFLEALIREVGVTSPPPTPTSSGHVPVSPLLPAPSAPTTTVAPIGRPIGRSGGMNLERGLEAMKARLKDSDPDAYLTFSTLESRLLANIHDERVYGSSETVRSERAHIVQELNRLAFNHLRQSFNELALVD